MFDTSLQDSYFGSAWNGQNSNFSSASQTPSFSVGGLVSGVTNGLLGIGNLIYSSKMQKKNLALMQKQIDYQKEYAQNGIQWRVADAKKAGLHPLYALGANTPTYTPVDMTQNTNLPNIKDPYESYQVGAMQAAQIENAQLQNELLRSQINALDAETMSNVSSNASGQNDFNTEISSPVGFSDLGEYKVRNDLGLDKNEQKQVATERLSEPTLLRDIALVYSAQARDYENGRLPRDKEYDLIEFNRTGHLIPVDKGQTRWQRGARLSDFIYHWLNPTMREMRKKLRGVR